jgi:uncharacterized protein with ParB-like and HNH nuclease domain
MSLTDYDVKSLEEILTSSEQYGIPKFQRPYSWRKTEYEQFLEDLKRVSDDDDPSYFIGSLFFKRAAAKKIIHIIDGQQRLATATIFIALIRDILEESGDYPDRISNIDSKYIQDKELVTRISYFKLNLGEINKTFFEEYIQKKEIPQTKFEKFSKDSGINDSNKLIFSCYKDYYAIITNEWCKGLDQQKKIEYLTKILTVLLKKFNTLSISVTDDSEAFMIFETLNDRGLELTIADLLKNYLFSQITDIPEHELDIHISRWDEMSEELGKTISSFLKHYWNSKNKHLSEKYVYRALKSKIKNKKEVLLFLKEIFDESEVYTKLINPDIGYWENQKIVDSLESISTLGLRQCFPVLLSAKSKLDTKNFEKVVKACLVFSFRYSTVCNKHNNKLERKYNDIAIKIRKGEITEVNGVINILKIDYPDDEEYSKAFSKLTLKDSQIAKYILREINDNYDKGDELKSSKNVTLEHIIPQNPTDEIRLKYENLNVDLNEITYRLANMTILGSEYNRKASNKQFTTKKEMYLQSKLPINEKLKKYNDWTTTEMDLWTKYLLDQSKEVWILEAV